MNLYLKDIMKSKGCTSIDLSSRLGVSKATVSYWINGKVFPDPDRLDDIAAALDVPVWRLFISADELHSADIEQPFVALVRDGAQLHSFNSKADLKRYAETL